MHTLREFQESVINSPHVRSRFISEETKLGFKSPKGTLITVHCSPIAKLRLLTNFVAILHIKSGNPTSLPYFNRNYDQTSTVFALYSEWGINTFCLKGKGLNSPFTPLALAFSQTTTEVVVTYPKSCSILKNT